MAMTLLLRNATKLNGVGFLNKSARLTPLRTYTSIVTAKCSTRAVEPAIKSVQLLSRSISLSAPKMAAAGGNYTALWTVERLVSLALLGILPVAFIVPSQPMDALMAISVVLHTHWGVEAMIVDYMRPGVVGNLLPKLSHGALLLLSVATLSGLFYMIYNDIGIAKSVKKLWAVKGQERGNNGV